MDKLELKLKKMECEDHLSELDAQTYISSVIFGFLAVVLLHIIIKAELIHQFNYELIASSGMIINTLVYMATILKIRREQYEFQEYLKALNEVEKDDGYDK